MDKRDNKHILHGNLAKVEPDKDRVLPQDYRPSSKPDQYGFESLPGSPEDLKKARAQFKDESKQDTK